MLGNIGNIPGDLSMNPSLLPPRGIFVPSNMIFNTQLPPAVLVTWIQLRCLAWRGWVTPPLSIPEIASLIGIHPARLNRHLAQLQDICALTCRSTRNGKLILSFFDEQTANKEDKAVTADRPGSAARNSKVQESQAPASYFPDRIMGYLSYWEEKDGFEITNDLERLSIGLEKAGKCY